MVRLLKHRSKGFTLIETSIVLFVFCLIFTIPTLKLVDFKERIELRNTTRLVKSVIENSTRKALLNRKVYRISYYKNDHEIDVRSGNESTHIPINPDITIDNLFNVYISNNGTVSPRTITVIGKKRQERIKIQMSWGRMIDG